LLTDRTITSQQLSAGAVFNSYPSIDAADLLPLTDQLYQITIFLIRGKNWIIILVEKNAA